jgi:mannosyltransferase
VPNFIYQATHTGDPWAPPPRLGAPVLISRDLIGGDRITAALVIAAVVGFAALFKKENRRTFDAKLALTLVLIPVGTLLLAWLASQITPAFVSRYFAPVLGATLMLAAWGAARSGIVGLVAIILAVVFVAHVSSYVPTYKSDMRDVAAEVAPYMQQGDLVISGQPEQVPLANYYLPSGLRYASTLGRSKDPTYADWVKALTRLKNAHPAATLGPLLATLRPGQQLLFVRPLTEGAHNWEAPWTELVRRRSAQWGAILQADRNLVPVWTAPHNYRGACCVADSAVLYKVR